MCIKIIYEYDFNSVFKWMYLKYSLYCVYIVPFFIIYVIDSEYFIWCMYVDDLYVIVVYDVISNVYR